MENARARGGTRAGGCSRRARRSCSSLDEDDRLIAASRRARETLGRARARPGCSRSSSCRASPWRPRRVPVEVDGTRESLLYLREPGELAAYEELRAGFTAAVSHELQDAARAGCSRCSRPRRCPRRTSTSLLEQGKAEVEQIRELIDDVLFLSELETGRAVVALASMPAAPVVRQVMDGLAERASRAGVMLKIRAGRRGRRCRSGRGCCAS